MVSPLRNYGWATFLATLGACGFPRPALVGDIDAGAGGGGLDGSVDDPACFGTFAKLCLAAVPNAPFTISMPVNIDTDSPLCATVRTGGTSYCVIAATDIAVNATLRATGTRPLILVASKSIVTTALIDVGSHLGSNPEIGAGSDPTACMLGIPATGAGAPAGGSFFGLGGSGGPGNNGTGAGGMPGPVAATVADVRGGCSAANGSGLYRGGHGGGAVFLIARERIDIRGGINAAGEAGAGNGGGGFGGFGGGSGGMIGFEAPTITANSLLLASGGGGGQGSEGIYEGAPGQDPVSTAPALGGGAAASKAGIGGAGSSAAVGARGMSGGPGAAGSGGGGGGGGAGLIKAPTDAVLGTQVSPAATP